MKTIELNEQQLNLLKEVIENYIEHSGMTGGFDKTTSVIFQQILTKIYEVTTNN